MKFGQETLLSLLKIITVKIVLINEYRIKPNSTLKVCWYLLLVAVGTDYISKATFLLEIATFVGLLTFFKSSKFYLTRKDVNNILSMIVIMAGIIISRLIYTPYLSNFLNISFVFKMSVFFLFTYFFITRYGFPFKSLYVIALFALPHFIGYLTGLNLHYHGQFGGFHGDPNYLSPDLLSSFLASLILMNSKKLKPQLKLLFIFIFLVSVFLILMSISRTASMSIILILILIIGKSYFSNKRSFFLKVLFILIVGLFVGSNILGIVLENEYIEKLNTRFLESGTGGGIVENERFVAWDISYETIQNTGLFTGYGVDAFLLNKYRFISHNSWLDIGIKNGSYSFWSHSIFYVLGLLNWGYKYFNNRARIPTWGVETFMLVLALSISFMMFSISVSHMYYYWFILFLIYIKGILHFPETKYFLKQKGLTSF